MLNPLQTTSRSGLSSIHFNLQFIKASILWMAWLYIAYSMGHKKFPFFETRYRATVILRSVFVSVPFYNCPSFYCCVSILKVRRKERLKNSKKNNAKNGMKTVPKRVRKIITVQRTFKKQCNNVFTSVPIGQMVFSDYAKSQILLLQEHGKTYERNVGKNGGIT